MAEVVVTLTGVAIVVLTAIDIWATLFEPRGLAPLSRRVQAGSWLVLRTSARLSPRTLALAGPISITVVVVTWFVLLVVGWAAVYWPHLESGFYFANPDADRGFAEALYLSAVTVSTLGYGDITPESAWLQVLVPLEAAFGFVLLTAAIAWVLSIYPALSRRQLFIDQAIQLSEVTGQDGRAAPIPSDILLDLNAQLSGFRTDLSQFPVTYYFTGHEHPLRLVRALRATSIISRSAAAREQTAIHGNMLEGSLQALLQKLGTGFLNLSLEETSEQRVLVELQRQQLGTTDDRLADVNARM